jgi:ATP-dependent helicase/nuclease subunit A
MEVAELRELGLPTRGDRVAEGEFVVVQGFVDLAVILEREIWIVDFKTDRVGAEEVEAKAADYRVQIELYARALERIFHRPAKRKWLYFLASRRAIAVA